MSWNSLPASAPFQAATHRRQVRGPSHFFDILKSLKLGACCFRGAIRVMPALEEDHWLCFSE
jgi:hypothetical protein